LQLNLNSEIMKRNWRRKILGGLSLTSALFIFQACYGTPQDFGLDVFIQGQVKSKKSGAPIKNIKVSLTDKIQYQFTDDIGKFSLYTEAADWYKISFDDIDSNQNGLFSSRDTIIYSREKEIFLDIVLEDF